MEPHEPESQVPDGAPPSEEDDSFELTEGTDPAVFPPVRGDATQVAEIPRREETPHTRFIQFYSRSSDNEEVWPELAPAVEGGLQAMTGTVRTPRERLLRRAGFLGVVAALIAVIAGSVIAVRGIPEESEVAVEPPVIEATEPDVKRAPVAAEVRPTLLSHDFLGQGIAVGEVLNVWVKEVQARKLVDSRLRSHIASQKVTVVNLWADWCLPCKRELGGIQDMFVKAGWKDHVAFVPLQTADPRDPVWALDTYGERMPPHAGFLSDARTRGGILDALRKVVVEAQGRKNTIKLPEAPEQVNLPITLVFDCLRELRLFHVGELAGSDFVTLADLIEKLRAEIGTRACRETELKDDAGQDGKQPPRAFCGDGKCGDGETAQNCCDCIVCKRTEDVCRPRDGKPACTRRKTKP